MGIVWKLFHLAAQKPHGCALRLIAAMVWVLPVLGSGGSFAACALPNNVALTANLPDYPFWRAIGDEMQQCGNLEIKFGFDAARVDFDPAAPDRDLGSIVGVSNASLQRLNEQKLLRPLDDLVELYGVLLHPRQLIKVEGKVMAIAVTANTRVLMVHRELLAQEGIRLPSTYEELMAAANKLAASALYKSPLTLAFQPGWHLTQEFIDLYLALGGSFFTEGRKPKINNSIAAEALTQMAKLTRFLPKEHLDRDSSGVLNDLMRFSAPMGITWISNAGPLDNPAVSRVPGKMQILPVPAGRAGGRPASSLWWDGFAIPASASKEEAEAAFLVALEGLDKDLLANHFGDALWLIPEFKPGRLSKEVLAGIDKGLPVYPDSQELSLLRRALNEHIEAFIKGKIDAAKALERAEADYVKAAREIGLPGF